MRAVQTVRNKMRRALRMPVKHCERCDANWGGCCCEYGRCNADRCVGGSYDCGVPSHAHVRTK